MVVDPEMIYAAIAALAAALAALYRTLLHRISESEKECRGELKRVWEFVNDLKAMSCSRQECEVRKLVIPPPPKRLD